MKRILMILVGCLCLLVAHAQEQYKMKVVVSNDGQLVGRYVRQTATTYIATLWTGKRKYPKQDTGWKCGPLRKARASSEDGRE